MAISATSLSTSIMVRHLNNVLLVLNISSMSIMLIVMNSCWRYWTILHLSTKLCIWSKSSNSTLTHQEESSSYLTMKSNKWRQKCFNNKQIKSQQWQLLPKINQNNDLFNRIKLSAVTSTTWLILFDLIPCFELFLMHLTEMEKDFIWFNLFTVEVASHTFFLVGCDVSLAELEE